MSCVHAMRISWAAALLGMLIPVPSDSQVIDFETLPGGAATVDQQTISTEYSSLGVTFTLLDPTSGLPIGSPRIAKTGSPLTGFEGCSANDTPYGYLGLGQSFLTDGTNLGVDGDLRIEYDTPVAQASGVILDIDCRISGGPPCEQWTITAFDTAGAVLDSVVLDAPQGAVNPGCLSPQAGPGDSEAFGWSFSLGADDIKSIVLRHTGIATNVGLGFDNFSVSGVPAPLDVSAISPADTVCNGELLTLSAFPSGGLPPYTFQWQQETSPSIWITLGTGSTQEIQPLSTTRFRVNVTDSNAHETTSPELMITVNSGGLLCSTGLIVSSTYNNRVVRYSFQSQLPQVLVTSGSGGLNSTASLVLGLDGNLYVNSQANHKVLRYDGNTGAFIDVFVTAGSGGLNLPVGLAFGPDGNLYIASAGTNSVLRYDGSTGAFIDAFVSSGLSVPTDLIFGPGDDLFVCSRNTDNVLLFDGTTGASLGEFVTAGSGGLDAPRGLVFGPDGNLYVAEEVNDSVRRYDGGTGAFIDVFVSSGSGGLDRANDIAFGSDGVLYVASFNNDMLLGYDGSTGAFLGALPDDLLDGPSWIAVGAPPQATTGILPGNTPPVILSVEPNVPNPFNPATTVRFNLLEAGRARATVLDVRGRVVATLIDRFLPAGGHDVKWNGASAAAGVYFFRLESAGATVSRKILLLK